MVRQNRHQHWWGNNSLAIRAHSCFVIICANFIDIIISVNFIKKERKKLQTEARFCSNIMRSLERTTLVEVVVKIR